jgi:glycosidase
LRSIYRDLIKLRKKYPAFYNDEVVWLQNTAPGEVVSFLRRDTKDEFVVIINLSSRRVTGSVELGDKEGFDPVKITGGPVPVDVLLPNFSLKGFGWFIYHRTLPK